MDAAKVVALAFLVDYWDRLGWKDQFGQSRFTARQRLLNNRNGARVTYTPQLVLNGKDYRRAPHDAFAARLADVGRGDAKAAIRLALKPAQDRLTVAGAWSTTDAPQAQGWLALYENRLVSVVTAGEYRNKRLHHDFVVHDLAGVFRAAASRMTSRSTRDGNVLISPSPRSCRTRVREMFFRRSP